MLLMLGKHCVVIVDCICPPIVFGSRLMCLNLIYLWWPYTALKICHIKREAGNKMLFLCSISLVV